MNCGIYKIENKVNGKVYIGKSKRLTGRISDHKRDLKTNKHWNDHLQNSWNKYGSESFNFEVLLYCDEENLSFYEEKSIKGYKSYKPEKGYNLIIEGQEKEFTEELRKKFSEMYTGEGNPFYGKTHTKESKNKISENHADFSGENHPLWNIGHSEDTKEKLCGPRPNMQGSNHPQWKEKIEVKCEICNEIYKVIPSNKDSSRFCSQECRNSWQSKRMSNENHPNWKDSIDLTCNYCGKNYEVVPSNKNSKFCSKDCQYKNRENKTGEKSNVSKLKKDQVKEIKERLNNGETQKSIAKDFPVSRSQISSIKHERSWTHVEV